MPASPTRTAEPAWAIATAPPSPAPAPERRGRGADPGRAAGDQPGPGAAGPHCRRARSTICKVLARHGLSRRRSGPRPLWRRYESSRPGALIHIDTARLARFGRPGHRARGRQRLASQCRRGARLPARGRRRPQPLCLRRAAPRRAAPTWPPSWSARWPTSASWGLGRPRRSWPTARSPTAAPPSSPRRSSAPGASHPHPALHAALERQGLCLRIVAVARMGGEAHPHPGGLTQAKGMPAPNRPGLRLDVSAPGRGRAGGGDLIGELAPMVLHRHRSVPRRPARDRRPIEAGGRHVRGHRRTQALSRRRPGGRGRGAGGRPVVPQLG